MDNAEIREGPQGYGIYSLKGCGVLEPGSETFVAYDGPYFVDRRFGRGLRQSFVLGIRNAHSGCGTSGESVADVMRRAVLRDGWSWTAGRKCSVGAPR